MLIETHAHLDFPEYDNDCQKVIERANASGVEAIINVSSDLKGCFKSVDLSKRYDCVYASCGIHPHHAGDVDDELIHRLRDLILSSSKVVAIGEVGLDFYRNLSPREIQHQAFIKFVKLSKELDLPLILHCREEAPDKKEAARSVLDIMRKNLEMPLKGVMHCFSGDGELLKECLDAGLYISFTCNITFKKADRLRETLKAAPLKRLLLETDSPFLAPQAKRGERNEPAYLSYLVEEIAKNTDIKREDIERITTKNAKTLFCI